MSDEFKVGDWVFSNHGLRTTDEGAHRVTAVTADYKPNDTLTLPTHPNHDNTGFWARDFRLATQEEIDAVPFREGDLAFSSMGIKKVCLGVLKGSPAVPNPLWEPQVWRHATPEEYRAQKEEPMTPLEELQAAAPGVALDVCQWGSRFSLDCLVGAGSKVHNIYKLAPLGSHYTMFPHNGAWESKDYETAAELVAAHPEVFAVELPPLFTGRVPDKDWSLGRWVGKDFSAVSQAGYAPHNGGWDLLPKAIKWYGGRVCPVLAPPLSAWINDVRVLEPTVLKKGDVLAVRTSEVVTKSFKAGDLVMHLHNKPRHNPPRAYVFKDRYIQENHRHATPTEIALYVEHKENPMSNYRELIEALPEGYCVRRWFRDDHFYVLNGSADRFTDVYALGGCWEAGGQTAATAKSLVKFLGWEPKDERFWQDKTTAFEEEIARLKSLTEAAKKDRKYFETRVADVERVRRERDKQITGLNEDTDALLQEVASLGSDLAEARSEDREDDLPPKGMLMQDVLHPGVPLVPVEWDDALLVKGSVWVYSGTGSGTVKDGQIAHWQQGCKLVHRCTLEPYVAPAPKPSLMKRATVPVLVAANCVAGAAAGHWLYLSLLSLF